MSDGPTNNVGSGNIAGVGVGPQGEPGKKSIKKLIRRIPFKEFIAEPVNEEKDTGQTAILNIIVNAFYKLANQENVDQRAYMILLGGAVLATMPGDKSGQFSRRLVQLALAKAKVKSDVE